MKTAWFALILAISVAILSLLQYEKYQMFVTDTKKTLAEFQSNIQPQLGYLTQNIKSLQNLEQTFLNKNVLNEWRLAEVGQLLRFADTELSLTGNAPAAIKLLQEADRILQPLEGAGILQLRQALAADRLQLESISSPNKENLWITLGALITEVNTLPIRGLRTDSFNKMTPTLPEESQETPPESKWKLALKKTLQSLKDLIKIQRHTKPIEPILPEAEQILARERLQLLLEQSRFALLQGNAEIYKNALSTALQWTQNYFETQDQRVNVFSEKIKTLSEVNIKPTFPDLKRSLALIPSGQ